MESIGLKKNRVLKYITSYYGIGKNKAFYLIKSLNFNSRQFGLILNLIQRNKIDRVLKRLRINQFLKRYLISIKMFNARIKTYKSMRNHLGLPSRGQRTRTNAKTKKKWRKVAL